MFKNTETMWQTTASNSFFYREIEYYYIIIHIHGPYCIPQYNLFNNFFIFVNLDFCVMINELLIGDIFINEENRSTNLF
jgi:hypothetical protein